MYGTYHIHVYPETDWNNVREQEDKSEHHNKPWAFPAP